MLLGVGITFSCMALIFNALAKGYDFFTYYFTLFLTPMMFLSGIFFPREQLPVKISAMQLKVMPTPSSTGQATISFQLWLMPRASITPRIAGMALIFNALAKGYDFFTYYFTLFLTPMMFLSGIFFPREQLPPIVRVIADWLEHHGREEQREVVAGGAWLLGGVMKLPRGDRITMLFSGGQKSIAIGAPLAATIFPPAIAGMVLLPTLAYHMAQLILSAPMATYLAADKKP